MLNAKLVLFIVTVCVFIYALSRPETSDEQFKNQHRRRRHRRRWYRFPHFKGFVRSRGICGTDLKSTVGRDGFYRDRTRYIGRVKPHLCHRRCRESPSCGGFDLANIKRGRGECTLHNYRPVRPIRDRAVKTLFCRHGKQCLCYWKPPITGEWLNPRDIWHTRYRYLNYQQPFIGDPVQRVRCRGRRYLLDVSGLVWQQKRRGTDWRNQYFWRLIGRHGRRLYCRRGRLYMQGKPGWHYRFSGRPFYWHLIKS